MKVIEERKTTYIYITETLEVLIQSSSIASARILEKTLTDLKKSWDLVSSLADNQTVKLQSCLKQSISFSELHQTTELWLIRAEENCSSFDSPATVLETVEIQITNLKVEYLNPDY